MVVSLCNRGGVEPAAALREFPSRESQKSSVFFGVVVEGSKAFCRAANITYLFSTFPIRRREAAQRLAFSDFSVCVKTSEKTDAKYRAEVTKVSRGVVKTFT